MTRCIRYLGTLFHTANHCVELFFKDPIPMISLAPEVPTDPDIFGKFLFLLKVVLHLNTSYLKLVTTSVALNGVMLHIKGSPTVYVPLLPAEHLDSVNLFQWYDKEKKIR